MQLRILARTLVIASSFGVALPFPYSSLWVLGCHSCWHLCQNVDVYRGGSSTTRGNDGLPDISISDARSLWKNKITVALDSEQPLYCCILPDLHPREHRFLWGNHNRRTIGSEGTCSYDGYIEINKDTFPAAWMNGKEIVPWSLSLEKGG